MSDPPSSLTHSRFLTTARGGTKFEDDQNFGRKGGLLLFPLLLRSGEMFRSDSLANLEVQTGSLRGKKSLASRGMAVSACEPVTRSFFSILSNLRPSLRPSPRRTDAAISVCGYANPPRFARSRHGCLDAHWPVPIPSSTAISAHRSSAVAASVRSGCSTLKAASESTHPASAGMDHVPALRVVRIHRNKSACCPRYSRPTTMPTALKPSPRAQLFPRATLPERRSGDGRGCPH